MKYVSVCSGVEAATLAWEKLGWQAIWFSEIDPFPSAVLNQRWPNVPNMGDMTKIEVKEENGNQIFTNGNGTVVSVPGRVDLLVGGTPCFATGTLVLTPKGYVPIETLKVGDDIYSGSGNIQKVEAIGSKLAECAIVDIEGRTAIFCTLDHQFYCAERKENLTDKDFHKVQVQNAVGMVVGGLPSNLQDKINDKQFRKQSGSYKLKTKNRYAYLIKGVKHVGAIRVYNITVSNEHNYIAEGLWTANCQSFSVAGKREGLDGASGLARTYVELLKTIKPKWFVWENVPGVFSSKDKESGIYDFNFLMQQFADCGYSLAWRVLDAQWVRVDSFPRAIPQRRRRVFVVGYLGDEWEKPCKVLFEPEGEFRNTPPSRIKGKGFTRDIETSLDESSWIGKSIYGDSSFGGYSLTNISPTLRCGGNTSTTDLILNGAEFPNVFVGVGNTISASHLGTQNCIVSMDRRKINNIDFDICSTICGSDYKGGKLITTSIGNGQICGLMNSTVELAQTLHCMHDQQAILIEYKCYENHSNDSRVKDMGNVCQTLSTRLGTGGNNQPLVQSFYKWHSPAVTASVITDNCSPTIVSAMGMGGPNITTPMFIVNNPCYSIAENIIGRKPNNGGNGIGYQSELSYTINATGVHGVTCNTSIRRLTPLECERLMGFPELLVMDIGKMTKDEFIAWELAQGNISVDLSLGKVFSHRTGGGNPCEPRELEGTILNGYKVVSLREKQIKKQCRVHRIIWIAANGLIPNNMVVDHINNNKLDNRIENLQLLTYIDNSKKAHEDGLIPHKTKISQETISEIMILNQEKKIPIQKLVDFYGISKSRYYELVKKIGHTQISWNGKSVEDCPDSHRYKACGNSMCVNVMEWIGRRIQLVEDNLI